MSHRRAARVRHAFTLIELLVVLSILSLLLALGAGAVFRVWRTSQDRLEAQHWKQMHDLGKPAARSRPLRVLFIGNSYTQANDLPGMVVALANASGESPRLQVDSHLVGGATLEQHWNGGTAVQKIRQGGWDFVVLQEQSQRPIFEKRLMHQYARLLEDEIRAVGAIPLYYLTWARRDIPEQQPHLTLAYVQIAQEKKAELAPVGMAWEKSLRRNPTLVLHDADGSHPNPSGTYLAACVFYAVLFSRSPEGLTGQVPAANVPAAQAQALQAIAWQARNEGREKVRPELGRQ